MYFGCDYYPEHWSEERWEEDVKLMKKAHFNIIRLAEFAWSKLEPKEGEFDFSWLDKAVSIFSKQDIQIVLGTPTAAPPLWIIKKHPDILPVDENEGRVSSGTRRHYCPNNSIYRDYTEKIVTALARHYARNKAIIGWQIDNEFGGSENPRCYCNNCKEKFIEWLKDKYDNLQSLNREWGTIFWSQTYNSWEEISLPLKRVPADHNPSLLLDFYRFSSHSYIDYQNFQIDIIRRLCPYHFITHNLMGLFNKIDYFKLAEKLDFVSWDVYPWEYHSRGLGTMTIGLIHDLMRSLKKKNFWIMEHQCSSVTRGIISPSPKPGEIRSWTYQSISHGADAIVYFRWRPSLFGAEQYHGGILLHDGSPESKSYHEIKSIGEEIEQWKDILAGSEVRAEIALLTSYDVQWALDIHHQSPDFDYFNHFIDYYQAIRSLGFQVDIVHPEGKLSQYSLVVAPNLILINQKIVNNLYNYVKSGGILLLTFRSAVKNWNNVIMDEVLPAKFKDLLGIEIHDYYSHPKGHENSIIGKEDSFCKEYKVNTWSEILDTSTAKPIAVYQRDYYAGKAAVTLNKYGEGKAVYVGTRAKKEFYKDLINYLLDKEGPLSIIKAPYQVETISRTKEERDFIFVINHTPESKFINITTSCKDILTNKVVEGTIRIGPYGVFILERLKK